jgi:solute carrier family 8 (sodium/calcium exchanger)
VCFCTSILWIGFLTALIGDVASHFGCTVNLKDSVTAIALVAMGTSLPGIDGQISHNRRVFKQPY